MNPSRRTTIRALGALATMSLAPWASAFGRDLELEVWRGPQCGCCEVWIDLMKKAGFKVKEQLVDNPAVWRTRAGMPVKFGSCHTARIGGYVIEGHVPSEDIKRLLAQRPAALGLAVPYMPIGSPGMEVEDGRRQAYDVLLVQRDGSAKTFTHYPAIAGKRS